MKNHNWSLVNNLKKERSSRDEKCEKCGHKLSCHDGLDGHCSKCECSRPLYTTVIIESASSLFAVGNHIIETGDMPSEIINAKSGVTKTKFGKVMRGTSKKK